MTTRLLDIACCRPDSALPKMLRQISMLYPMTTAHAGWLVAFARGEKSVRIFVNGSARKVVFPMTD